MMIPRSKTSLCAVRGLVLIVLIALCAATGCSPRDFLTRRLAADLISASDAFKAPQVFLLRTGVISNRDFTSPESLVLQRRGWIAGDEQKCPPGIDPAPCWDVALTPLGVGVVRPLISNALQDSGTIAIQTAHRELTGIDGISKSGNFADVDFVWRWVSLNPMGAALYDSGVRYRSTVQFRGYDDGWRVVNQAVRGNQTLDEALRNAVPTAP